MLLNWLNVPIFVITLHNYDSCIERINFINRVSPSWVSFQNGFNNSAAYIRFYFSHMNIKFIQMPNNSMVHTRMQWNYWKRVNEKWKFNKYCKNWFMQFNFPNVGQLCGSQTALNVNWFKSIYREFSRHTHLHIGLKNLQITFRRQNSQIQFLLSFPCIYFWLSWNFNYFERLIFTFAKFVLLISNVFMVGKEELFLKSPKLENLFIITS